MQLASTDFPLSKKIKRRRETCAFFPPVGEYKANRPMAPTDIAVERPLPHNLEAERSILGAILLDNHALNAAVEKLRAEDFSLPQHRHIFEGMVQLGVNVSRPSTPLP